MGCSEQLVQNLQEVVPPTLHALHHKIPVAEDLCWDDRIDLLFCAGGVGELGARGKSRQIAMGRGCPQPHAGHHSHAHPATRAGVSSGKRPGFARWRGSRWQVSSLPSYSLTLL